MMKWKDLGAVKLGRAAVRSASNKERNLVEIAAYDGDGGAIDMYLSSDEFNEFKKYINSIKIFE